LQAINKLARVHSNASDLVARNQLFQQLLGLLASERTDALDCLLQLRFALFARRRWSMSFFPSARASAKKTQARALQQKNTNMQQLLAQLAERHYRHLGGDCYTELRIGGVGSHAWRRVQPIRAVVEAATASQQLSRAAIDSLVEELTRCEDAAFPPLVKSRGVYSFSNGVYVCHERAFYHYAPEGDQQSVASLPHTLAAYRYIDAPFTGNSDSGWVDIPTPALDALLALQEIDSRETKSWLCVLIGRLLYARGDLDRTPMLLCLQGAGGLLLCKLVASFYDVSDVGIVQQDLASHTDKLMLIVPWLLGRPCPLRAGEIFALASQLRQSALLWSDVAPHWPAESALATVALRQSPRPLLLLPIPLVRRISLQPQHDNVALCAELPNLLVKCNLAYCYAVAEYGEDHLTSGLPESMRRHIRPIELE
jgi:hypothetical protein